MEKTIRFLPKDIPYLIAAFLSEEQQKAYEDAVRHFKNERARNVLNVPRNGSNLFKVLLLNQIGIRTVTLSELDQIVQADRDFLTGTFEDAPSVALRSNGDSYEPNDYLAKYLSRLIRKRKFREPVVINGLGLKEDPHSPYGLSFNAKRLDFFEAPELNHKNNHRRFKVLDKRGMPVFDDSGNRILYTRDSGLSRLYLGGDLYLDSNSGSLAVSYGDGRVVVVSAEGTSPKK